MELAQNAITYALIQAATLEFLVPGEKQYPLMLRAIGQELEHHVELLRSLASLLENT